MGKFSQNAKQDDKPANIREIIVGILENHHKKTGNDQVDYYLNLFRPRTSTERVYVKSTTVGGEILQTEIDPYHERIKYLLNKYLGLNKGFQETIVNARGEGVFWEGDELEYFYKVWDEHERQQDMGIEAYRQAALRRLREL